MKFLITIVFLISAAYAIRQKEDKLILPESGMTLHVNQQLLLGESSFSPIYLHVFEVDNEGPLEHVNLTDETNRTAMKIDSFRQLKDKGHSVWIAYLVREGDNKVFACELEEAIKSREIFLIK